MNLQTDDGAMEQVLRQAQVIAVVGHSDKPGRTSYRIAQFLRQVGYRVYAVNPTVAEIDGQPCYESLRQVPEPIDIVNVFRRADYLPDIVEEAIATNAKTVWAQLGINHPAAAQAAQAAGLTIVMDACIKIEHCRLIEPT